MSLESLLGENEVRITDAVNISQADLEKHELELYRKNKILIDAIEELPITVRDSIQDLILKTLDSYL